MVELELNKDEEPKYTSKKRELKKEIQSLTELHNKEKQRKKEFEEKRKKEKENFEQKIAQIEQKRMQEKENMLKKGLCWNCKQKIDKGWLYCPYCSTELKIKHTPVLQTSEN